MPYSLHEKSGLVSLPLNPEDVLNFKKEYADPKTVKISKFKFLDNTNVVKGEANKLITQAFDFSSDVEEEVDINTKKDFKILEDAVPE